MRRILCITVTFTFAAEGDFLKAAGDEREAAGQQVCRCLAVLFPRTPQTLGAVSLKHGTGQSQGELREL